MAQAPEKISIADAITGNGLLSMYGVPVKDMAPGDFSKVIQGRLDGFAYIKAYRIGTFCQRLPTPILMLVSGAGENPDEDDNCARKGERVWNVLPTDRTVGMTPSLASFNDLLEDVTTRGIDGGLSLENPRLQDGKACVDVHAWARIEIFGAHVDFDQRIPVCVQGCVTVYDIGWANIQVCYGGDNKICAKLCIGKWGLSKCWDYCVAIPMAAASAECGCQKH